MEQFAGAVDDLRSTGRRVGWFPASTGGSTRNIWVMFGKVSLGKQLLGYPCQRYTLVKVIPPTYGETFQNLFPSSHTLMEVAAHFVGQHGWANFFVGFWVWVQGLVRVKPLIFFPKWPTLFGSYQCCQTSTSFFEECIDEIQIYQGSMGRLGLWGLSLSGSHPVGFWHAAIPHGMDL